MSDSIEHSDWEEQLQDWIDGDLDAVQSAALDEHLLVCPSCRARMNALQAVDEVLCRSLPPEALDASFDRRVLDRVAEVEKAGWVALRERLERERQAQIAALARQWRRAWKLLTLNTVAGVAAVIALATGFGGLETVANVIDQAAPLLKDAALHPTTAVLTTVLAAAGLSGGLLWLMRAFDSMDGHAQ